jgi:hypothetical protein
MNLKALILFISLVIYSACAMELEKEHPQDAPGFKFLLNPETGVIEDSPNHHMLEEYDHFVGELMGGYGALRDATQKKVDEITEDLSKMDKASAEYLGTKIYLKKLEGKVKKYKNKAEDLVDQQFLLRKVLLALLNSQPMSKSDEHKYPMQFQPYVFTNYEFLTSKSVPEHDHMEHFFSQDNSLTDAKLGQGLLPMKITYLLPEELAHAMRKLSQASPYKVYNIQRGIFELSELYIHVIDPSSHKPQLTLSKEMHLSMYQVQAAKREVTVEAVIQEAIQILTEKADYVIIPQLAPQYYFFKILETFQTEIPMLQEQLLSASQKKQEEPADQACAG